MILLPANLVIGAKSEVAGSYGYVDILVQNDVFLIGKKYTLDFKLTSVMTDIFGSLKGDEPVNLLNPKGKYALINEDGTQLTADDLKIKRYCVVFRKNHINNEKQFIICKCCNCCKCRCGGWTVPCFR